MGGNVPLKGLCVTSARVTIKMNEWKELNAIHIIDLPGVWQSSLENTRNMKLTQELSNRQSQAEQATEGMTSMHCFQMDVCYIHTIGNNHENMKSKPTIWAKHKTWYLPNRSACLKTTTWITNRARIHSHLNLAMHLASSEMRIAPTSILEPNRVEWSLWASINMLAT